MHDTLDAAQYELPAGALFDVVALDGEAAERSRLITQLRDRITKGRMLQEEWTRRFEDLYEEALQRNFSSPSLIEWAAALFEKGRAASERLHPVVDAMQYRLTADASRLDAESLELFHAAIELAVGWIMPYSRLCDRLLDLASERRSPDSNVLRAHPVAGEIDYAELSREHMTRYPKIRAALAE
jgi:hypothetical protein